VIGDCRRQQLRFELRRQAPVGIGIRGEAAAALEEIKTLLASNPILTAPSWGEPMLLYISATNQVVSAVLVIERKTEGHKLQVQKPVYYVSEVLTPCKTRYPHYQKIAYTVFMASRSSATIFKSARSWWHPKYH
jgi:hypothetical protein